MLREDQKNDIKKAIEKFKQDYGLGDEKLQFIQSSNGKGFDSKPSLSIRGNMDINSSPPASVIMDFLREEYSTISQDVESSSASLVCCCSKN